MSNNLRDDMMFFYGQLDAIEWAICTDHKVPFDLIEAMKEQYKYILKRAFFEDFKDE